METPVPQGADRRASPGATRPSADRSGGSAGSARRLAVAGLAAAAVLALVLAAPAAAQWSQEGRTPTRNASAPTDGPPVAWVQEASDPETENNTILWSANPGKEHGDEGEAEPMTAAPVIEDGLVVVATEGGTVAAYGALRGQQVWDYQVPASDNVDDVVGAPAVVEDPTADTGHLVVVGARDGVVRALDLDTGDVQWRTDLDPSGGDSVATSVHARDGRVFVGTEEDELVALDVEGGDEVWRKGGPARLEAGFTSATTGDGDWLYVPTSQELYRFRPATGSSLSADVNGNILGAVAVDEAAQRVYYGITEGDTQGRAWARNASNFASDWDRRISSGGLGADALDVDDSLYLGNDRGKLYARDAADGSARWSADLVSSPTYDDALRGLPAEANGTLYVPSEDGLLFAVDAESGEKLWTLNLRSGCDPEGQLTCGISSPAVWEEKLYVTTEGGVLWVVGPESAAGPQPPAAEAGVLERGLTVELDASGSSDPNGDDLAFTWRLGDGTTAEAGELAYTYREPGNYTVTLVAADGTGRTDTATVRVEARERASTPWSGPGGDPGADRASPDQGPPSWTERWVRSFPADLASDPLAGAWGVAAASTDGTVRAYGLDGSLDWLRDLPDAEALARANGSLYVASRDRIRALAAADGADEANLTLSESSVSLAARGPLAAAGDDTGGITVWNASSGQNWTRDHPNRIRDGPVFGPDGDLVAVLTVTNNLHVYRAEDGTPSYTKTALGMEARQMSVDGDGVVLSGLTSNVNDGALRGLDLETGTIRWTHETSHEVLDHAAGDRVHAATAGDEVLAVNRTGDLPAGEDRTAWTASLEATPRDGLAASAGAVLVPTADGVVLLDPDDGARLDAATVGDGARRGAVFETLAALQRDPLPERQPALVVAGTLPYEAGFTVTPSNLTAGESARFEDASRAPDDAGRTFAFGDGNATAAETATHAYGEAGEYTVTLEVDAASGAPRLVTRGNVTVGPAPDDGDGGEPPDGNETAPPGDGNETDGEDGAPPPDGDGGDDDGGAYRPDAAVPGFGAALALAASLAAAVHRRR